LTTAFRGDDLIVVSGECAADTGGPSVTWHYRIVRGRLTSEFEFIASGWLVTKPHPDGKATARVGLAVLSPDGTRLATAAREKAVQIWDAKTGKHFDMLPQRGFVEALAWSPDGETLALNAGTTVRLYDVAARAERVAFKVKYCYLPRMAFSPDGRLLATTDNGTGVHLWDVATGVRRTTLRAGRERRVPVAFAPDGLTIAAGGANGTVAVWDV
jgi:WD40 repeat protein